MGVAKRRVSHAAQGDRRANQRLTVPNLEEFPHCHERKQIHHACPNCGYYAGREAIRIKQRTPKEANPS